MNFHTLAQRLTMRRDTEHALRCLYRIQLTAMRTDPPGPARRHKRHVIHTLMLGE